MIYSFQEEKVEKAAPVVEEEEERDPLAELLGTDDKVRVRIHRLLRLLGSLRMVTKLCSAT